MRTVHVIGVAELPFVAQDVRSEAELVQAVTAAALADAGIGRKDVGFTCSGSSDYSMGRPFSFVMALDGIGAWPPIRESHVEMDGAWALYEAWVRLQHGDVDTALVYAFGKSSLGDPDDVLALQLDPYTLQPLGVRPDDLAGLQRSAMGFDGPLEGATHGDGAAAIVLRVEGDGPRIAAIDHRIDPMDPGLRDLSTCRSASLAAEKTGAAGAEIAHLHATFAHEEALLSRALGLTGRVESSRSRNVPMVSGLANIARATRSVRDGAASAVAHATQGPCLQQNLVCRLEAT
ncbi:MAG: lipid-transfer protein [Proteobacteria bacterium]|nr:lipid-transfer protein [Pseudomonadota bacterium]